ncbi:hypothetical protein NDA16_001616 [Ustilago loliicola]|nr:hypothetical protein NDA16_001616 [Ustilago loliicola]
MYRTYGHGTYWSAHDSIELQRYVGSISGSSPEPARKDGRQAETLLELSLSAGTAKLSLYPLEHGRIDDDFKDGNKRLDLSIAFFHQGTFHTIIMSKEAAGFEAEEAEYRSGMNWFDQRYNYHCTWHFRPDDAQVQMLRFVRCSIVHIAVHGYWLQDHPFYPNQALPVVSQPERALKSVMALLTAPDSDYVVLAPAMPPSETRVIRAHRRILCDSSGFFKTLLESEFAEASTLQGHNQHETESASSNAETRPDSGPASKRLKEDASPVSITSSVATIKLPDVTYVQLHTLLYYIYTGVATFQRRCDLVDDEHPSPSVGTSGSLSTSQVDGTPGGFAEPMPWWAGSQYPANAFDMYRLADKFGYDGLRREAIRHIASDMAMLDLLANAEEYEEIKLFPEIAQVYREYCELYKKQIKSECNDHEEIFTAFGVDPSETT